MNLRSNKTKILKAYANSIKNLLLYNAWKNNAMLTLKETVENDLEDSVIEDTTIEYKLLLIFNTLTQTESNRLRQEKQ